MKILMIAYYFPPDSSSGAFRPFFFANHLSGAGDKVTVLTAREEDFLAEQSLDFELLAGLDRRVVVERCRVYQPKDRLLALRSRILGQAVEAVGQSRPESGENKRGGSQRVKDFVTDLLTTPDVHVGWIPSCVRKALSIIRGERPDIIFATGNPWSDLVVGVIVKRLTGVPLAVDFRDPWIANPLHALRGGLCRKIDGWLERLVIASADLLIANTEEMRCDFLARYPSLTPERTVAITNGFEEYLPEVLIKTGNRLTLTHVGDLYFSRNPRHLLEAARNAIERGRIDSDRFRLRFVGLLAIDDPDIAVLLASPTLAPCTEVVQRVPFGEALRAMCESDVLILHHPGFPLTVPRKLYDYMSSRRPVLCIADSGSAVWSLMERYGLGRVCDNDPGRLEEALADIYESWQNGLLVPLSSDRCDNFLNRNLAARLRSCLDETLRRTATSRNNIAVPSGNNEMGELKSNV